MIFECDGTDDSHGHIETGPFALKLWIWARAMPHKNFDRGKISEEVVNISGNLPSIEFEVAKHDLQAEKVVVILFVELEIDIVVARTIST